MKSSIKREYCTKEIWRKGELLTTPGQRYSRNEHTHARVAAVDMTSTIGPHPTPPAPLRRRQRCASGFRPRLLRPLGRLAAAGAGNGFRLRLHRRRAAEPRGQRAAALARIGRDRRGV